MKNDPNYYGDAYLKLAFSVDFWGTRGYLNQVQQGSLPNSPYNETHWPPKSGEGSNFGDLYKQALAETDTDKRIEIEHEMQKAEYDNGGYIIPYFNSLIDGHSTKVAGTQAQQGHAEPRRASGTGSALSGSPENGAARMKFLRGGGIAGFIIRRLLLGLLVLFLVSVIVFVSTQLLGDPARAILGRDATPDRLAALHKQLHLDSSKVGQYFQLARRPAARRPRDVAGVVPAGQLACSAPASRTPRCWWSWPR